MVSEEVSAPSWLHRFIIGRGGENIKSITQDLHVTVNFPNEGDVIVIEGPPEEVQVARESLENFTDGLVSMNMLSIHYCELSIHYFFRWLLWYMLRYILIRNFILTSLGRKV